MTLVYALPAHEAWICDRFVAEWNSCSSMATQDLTRADTIWLLSDWAWQQIPIDLLRERYVVTSVHHIVPEKFDARARAEFAARDLITNLYHVPCQATYEQVVELTQKPIYVIPFWVNQNIWAPHTLPASTLRLKHGIPRDKFVIGSFQRDTEGRDLKTPKLEKGPDLLCDALEKIKLQNDRLFVVLAGWRRQYVIERLAAAKIPYKYFERPEQHVIHDLYASLDLYAVTARYEGGPQSIIECAAMMVPIVSTPVGLAPEILAPESVGDDITQLVPNVKLAHENVKGLFMPRGMAAFESLFAGSNR